MAACTNFQLTVYIWRTIENAPTPFPPVHLETLVFPDLRVDTSGRITGEVFIGSTPLSPVTGSCSPLTRPDGTLLTLEFNWGTRDIFLVGFTHLDGIIMFKGRYIALPHTGVVPETIDRIVTALTPPDVGETGTATGQQT
jgi:hypothetical protein